MMPLYFMILLLALGVGVHSDESTLELGSGEMESQTTALPTVNLIDENGDIVTNPTGELKNFTPHDDITTTTEVVDLNIQENQGGESSTLKTDINEDGEITEIHSEFSTSITMVVTREITTQPAEEPSIETTTESDPTTTTETPVPTVTSTMSTKISTTTLGETTVSMKQTTMASMKQTTTSSSTTTAPGKLDKPTGHSAQRQAEDERDICVFTNPDFKCFEEPVTCYGEGEIECWGGEDSASSSSSKSEDYSEYEDPESGTIGTFPPNLVGVGTPKKISFYNKQSFTTEGNTEIAENGMDENSEKEMNTLTTQMVEGVSNATTEPTVTTENAFTVETTESKSDVESVSEMARKTPTGEPTSATMLETTDASTFQSTIDLGNVSETEAIKNINDTEETRPTVPADYDGSTVISDEPVGVSDVIRRRRGISYEGYTSEPHYEELYKKKVDNMLDRMRNETCRLYGNIRCLPVPTHRNCVGKTFCQAVRIKSEVPASSKPKGLEIWMIVVIVICGLFGFLTIGMVTYLIIHSCKKLKVQPAHDVTPLNYITKKAETVETA